MSVDFSLKANDNIPVPKNVFGEYKYDKIPDEVFTEAFPVSNLAWIIPKPIVSINSYKKLADTIIITNPIITLNILLALDFDLYKKYIKKNNGTNIRFVTEQAISVNNRYSTISLKLGFLDNLKNRAGVINKVIRWGSW